MTVESEQALGPSFEEQQQHEKKKEKMMNMYIHVK
jgi:hypothetical protein